MNDKPVYTYAEYAALEEKLERLEKLTSKIEYLERLEAERDNLLSVLNGIGEVARKAKEVSGYILARHVEGVLAQYEAGEK